MTTTTDNDRTTGPADQHGAPRRTPDIVRRAWVRVLMLDLGLVKTETALRTLFSVPAGMGLGYLIAVSVGLPGILGLLIGAMPAFISCLVVVDASAWRVAGRTGALVVPFVASLSSSIALHRFRVLELVLIVGLLFLQFAAAGWGKWAHDAAVVLFAGYLCGLLTPVPETSVVGLALIGAASLAATIVVRTVAFRPAPYRSLLRTRRAFVGWASTVLVAAEALLAAEGPGTADRRASQHARRRLRRRLGRLQEVALSADGMLAATGSGTAGEAAETLHRLLFDTHLAVDGLGRTAESLVATGAPGDVRAIVREALQTVIAGGGALGDDAARTLLARYRVTPAGHQGLAGPTHVVHRAAWQLADLAATTATWRRLRDELPRDGSGVPFSSPVVLVGGRPSGAVPVLEDALEGGGLSGPWRRLHISASIRTGIQAAVAVAIVEPLALALSGQRFYWGVIGAMIVFAGTNSTHDRIRKGLHRGLGTVLGGAIGIGLVDLLGTTHPATTIVVVVVALAIGMYGFGGVYSVWVTCLVVVLCQVYAYSGSFSDALIPLRLAENLLGAAVAILVSVLVFPVATGAMHRSAVRRQLAAARAFVLEAGGGPDTAGGLRPASRALDAATYQLDAVTKPMVRVPTGGGTRGDAMTGASLRSVAVFARELAGRAGQTGTDAAVADAAVADAAVADAAVADADAADVARAMADVAGVLATSIDALSGAVGAVGARRVGGGRHERAGARADDVWTRVGMRIEEIDAMLPDDASGPEWVRDRLHCLGRVDDALALLAERVGLPVTGVAASGATPSARVRRAERLVARRFADR
ncbi:FUSC family protein [Curtobacterium sp. Leaf261]|uniref:FUSC family protein n=1 Tax=Curtobacterium sp. Leaf261 TaxID=1736311 RepID=UPI0006FE8D91|nr:FUSC family protein [Curtobacterium sp. Leaf261]KQO64816.1 hypothetical protein ASF23_01070 [Curtobacterium sp. Leaf261]